MTDYVDAAAQVIGLPIRPEDRAAVEADFGRLAEIAATYLDFPLNDTIQPAPVFEP